MQGASFFLMLSLFSLLGSAFSLLVAVLDKDKHEIEIYEFSTVISLLLSVFFFYMCLAIKEHI